MISSNFKTHIAGTSVPAPSFRKGLIVDNVLAFIEANLIRFQEEYVNEYGDSEERISQYLINLFSDFARSETFIFCKEAIQEQSKGNDRRVDIGVFLHRSDRSPFFTIEAKRLPTPGGVEREKEYVVGTTKKPSSGGVERYKLGLHGVDIDRSALIAYVEDLTFDHWVAKINEWVEELIAAGPGLNIEWISDDKLKDQFILSIDKVVRFRGKHSRKDRNSIELSHYFVQIKSKH